jgi:hypothetical protein
MKLYVWEGDGVLQDYTSGMICAIADNLEDAWKVIERADEATTWQHEGKERVWNFPQYPTTVIDLSNAQPMAFVCWGGG